MEANSTYLIIGSVDIDNNQGEIDPLTSLSCTFLSSEAIYNGDPEMFYKYGCNATRTITNAGGGVNLTCLFITNDEDCKTQMVIHNYAGPNNPQYDFRYTALFIKLG